MKIHHRVCITSKDIKFVASLKELDINFKTDNVPASKNLLYYFDIVESDPRWPIIEKMIKRFGASDVYQTIFEPEEIREAEWSRIIPLAQRGYPQPQKNWVSNRYNYEDFCARCGTYRQKSSYRIGKEPNPQRYDFSSLFWAYVLFGTPEIFLELELNAIVGYEKWEVIVNKNNLPSNVVHQLYVSGITQPGLVAEDLDRTTCPQCKFTKYNPHKRGRMLINRGALVPKVDIVETFEWFGWGHSAFREILISNRFAKLILVV